jgi:hypothetical protein
MRTIMGFCIIAITMVSCDDLGTSQMATRLSAYTNRDVYSIGETILVGLNNKSEKVLYLEVCCSSPDLRIQKKLENDWTPPGVCDAMCPPSAIILQAHQVIVDSVHIFQPGRYRLMMRYRLTSLGSANDSTLSNEFGVQ